MIIDRSNISEIVNITGIKPDKDYGQNFLIEPLICERIVNSLELKVNDTVVEIGPGLGSLTHFLSLNNNGVSIVDIDERMTSFLKVVYNESKNIDVVNCDIRKFDVSNFNKVIGNLPYNITTETIQYFLINAVNAERMVFMIQSETLSHFVDIEGKEYGPTSVLIHLLGDIRRLFTVKAGSFYPAPKCNSVLFSIDINKDCDREMALQAFNISKQLFLNRRKTISNNLLNYLKDKDRVSKLCSDLSIAPSMRPEQLKPIMYLSIAKYLSSAK